METRKSIRRCARGHLRRHYLLLTVICAVSVFLGTEFTQIVDNAQTWYDILTGRVTQIDAGGVREDDESLTGRLLDDLVKDNLEAGYERAAERLKALRAADDAGSVLGRRRGALAALANAVSSGQLYATAGMALHSVVHSGAAAAVLLILLSLALYALVWIFLRNMISAIMRRVFLETRLYPEYPVSHLLYFRMVGRWARTALTLLWVSVLHTLWSLTVAGYVVKRYSYFLVPFIAAENPDIRPREAVLLSRRMMNGHKMDCFLLELSFAGWMLLGFVTFGAADVLWTAPYRMAAYTELYARLREEAKARGIPGAERLNDDRLFEKAAEAELRRQYDDIARREDLILNDIVELTPAQRFFAKNFGVWLGGTDEKRVYSRQEGLRHQAATGRKEMLGLAYPDRLSPLWDRENAQLTGKVSYLSPCTVWSLVLAFFLFSAVGWLWEVSLHMITHGVFVNRGVLHGPWLPIYGGGVTLIAVLLFRFREKPAVEALAITLLCGVVEYATSYAMEASRGMRWWDYSGYYLNLNGRICGEGLAVFAVGGMAAIYLLVPVLDAMLTRASRKAVIPLCAALLLCFGGDLAYSRSHPNIGEGITEEAPAAPEGPETGDPADSLE